jgi:hypothetical protein
MQKQGLLKERNFEKEPFLAIIPVVLNIDTVP